MKSDSLKAPLGVSRNEPLLSALLAVVVTLLTYAPLIPQLGFYRDDWYLIWTAQSQGVPGIMKLFEGDRPFLGWLYVFDYRLLGSTPWHWHLYALFIKILSVLAFLWLMRSLWPTKKIETTFITLLFIVYPGFYQQPDATTFKNLLLAYAAAMFSLALTVQALKAKLIANKIILTILAVLTAAFYIFIYEALIGLEAARLLFIWYYLNGQMTKDWKVTLRKTFMESIPYLLFAAGFVYWRIFLFHSTRRATNVDVLLSEYTSLPLHNLARLLFETLKDLAETTFLAWGVPYYQFTVQTDYRTFALSAVFVCLVLGSAGLYYFLVRGQAEARSEAETNPHVERDWILLGAVITVITTLPIILAGRNVIFSVQWDRYTYQSLLGVSLIIGGLIFYAVKGRLRWGLFSALIITGVTTQFFSADFYRTFWTIERESMWQLVWRAPQIETGTTLLLSLPSGYNPAEEYEVWGPVNLIYYPKDSVKVAGQVIYEQIWLDLASGTKERHRVRETIPVRRDYAKVVILSQPSQNSCLHILDGKRFDQTVTESFNIQGIAKYSDTDLIVPDGGQVTPPGAIFGAEPPHTWCYYYQKIDLARQKMDWQSAAKLADEALSLGLVPSDTSEWLPALEAYIQLKDTKHSQQVAQLIWEDRQAFAEICGRLELFKGQPADYDRDLLIAALCKRG